MSVKLMDCTLRDGGNVVGKGFNAEITDLKIILAKNRNGPIGHFWLAFDNKTNAFYTKEYRDDEYE